MTTKHVQYWFKKLKGAIISIRREVRVLKNCPKTRSIQKSHIISPSMARFIFLSWFVTERSTARLFFLSFDITEMSTACLVSSFWDATGRRECKYWNAINLDLIPYRKGQECLQAGVEPLWRMWWKRYQQRTQIEVLPRGNRGKHSPTLVANFSRGMRR